MNEKARFEFLAGTATQRIQRLGEIASRSARPWSEFYCAPASTENWYESY